MEGRPIERGRIEGRMEEGTMSTMQGVGSGNLDGNLDAIRLEIGDEPLGIAQLGVRVRARGRPGEADRALLVAGVIDHHRVALFQGGQMP